MLKAERQDKMTKLVKASFKDHINWISDENKKAAPPESDNFF